MTDKDRPRLLLSALVMLLFGYAYVRNPNNALLVGALISMASNATQYWLGSSKGSADKSDQIERTATEARDERETITRDTPQDVTVVNEPSEPVPTTQTRKP